MDGKDIKYHVRIYLMFIIFYYLHNARTLCCLPVKETTNIIASAPSRHSTSNFSGGSSQLSIDTDYNVQAIRSAINIKK